jgi:peptidyl-prolyl cis-trans isomerase SurA
MVRDEMKFFHLTAIAALLFFVFFGVAQAQVAVVAVVNDHAISDFDIQQRIKLLQFLGENDPAKLSRKAITNAIIDDYVKIDEAKRAKVDPSDKEVDDRIKAMAQNMKTDEKGVTAKLESAGLTMTGLRQYAEAQMALSRLLQAKFREKIAVDPAEVDKKIAEIKAEINSKVAKIESDPRRQPVKVLKLQEVNFPAEGNDPQLLESRAVEASQVAQKIKGCESIKASTGGIFNVQIGRAIEADSRKLPPALMQEINTRGIGKPIGPIRYAKGIQLLVYCGSRTVTPPPINATMPTREQVQMMTLNEKYAAVEGKYIAIMRKSAVIEYKDPSLAQ